MNDETSFLIVLDSCGAGAMPDAESFGDVGVHTLRSCATSEYLNIPNLRKLGIGNIDGQNFLGIAERWNLEVILQRRRK